MARPLTPLISRESATRAALEIIDTAGLAGFSLNRLAAQLDVKAPSLYYHFTDRADVLAAVAGHILGAGRIPMQEPGPDWPDFFVTLALNLRRSVLKHRNAAPLLLDYMSRDVLLAPYETAVAFLTRSGVPEHLHLRIADGMERLSIGASLAEAMRTPADHDLLFPDVDPESQPALARAIAANELDATEQFEEMIRSYLHGVMRHEDARTRGVSTTR